MHLPTRRDFLQAGFAGAAAVLTLEQDAEACPLGKIIKRAIAPRRREAPVAQRPINTILHQIGKVAGACKNVFAQENFDESPTKGVVVWGLWHFHPDAPQRDLRRVERVNAVYWDAVTTVQDIPDAGIDVVHQEGCVEGRVKQYMDFYRQVHRDLMRLQLQVPIPFSFSRKIEPSDDEVEERMKDPKAFHQSVMQWIHPRDRGPWQMSLTPLTRIGVGNVLALQGKITILPTEDPVIDAKAEEAEYGRNLQEYIRWVILARNAHFAKVICNNRRRINHMFVGRNHHLVDPLKERAAETGQRISVLTIDTY